MTNQPVPMLPFTGPADRTCPYCGAEEANDWLLSNNHWVPSTFATERGLCIAMDLTRNHVVHDAQRLVEAPGEGCPRAPRQGPEVSRP